MNVTFHRLKMDVVVVITKALMLSLINSVFRTDSSFDLFTPVYDDSCTFDECEYIKEVFGGKHWLQVADEHVFLRGEILPFFSDKALIYFLPSFMIMLINNYEEMDVFRDQFLQELNQDDSSCEDVIYRKLLVSNLLTNEHLEAIAKFLEYTHSTYDDKDALEALSTGWNNYLVD